VLQGEGYDLLATIQQDRIGRGDEGICLGSQQLLEGGVDLARIAGNILPSTTASSTFVQSPFQYASGEDHLP
jgi:hypothetical protein